MTAPRRKKEGFQDEPGIRTVAVMLGASKLQARSQRVERVQGVMNRLSFRGFRLTGEKLPLAGEHQKFGLFDPFTHPAPVALEERGHVLPVPGLRPIRWIRPGSPIGMPLGSSLMVVSIWFHSVPSLSTTGLPPCARASTVGACVQVFQ